MFLILGLELVRVFGTPQFWRDNLSVLALASSTHWMMVAIGRLTTEELFLLSAVPLGKYLHDRIVNSDDLW